MASNGEFPCFLDCEASSLRCDSYPIEVAWSLEDGSIESHVLNPELIVGWDDWDASSERIHGLGRGYLSENGENPQLVAQRMSAVLVGKTLYSDAKAYDEFWVQRLYAAAGLEMAFTVDCLYKGLLIDVLPRYVLNDPAELNQLAEKVRAQIGGREHRAAWDVEYLQKLYQLALT